MSAWRPDIDVLLTDSEDDDEGGGVVERPTNLREAMLFVVDANLSKQPERFKEALQIIRGAFITGLLANDKDLMGVVFANTEMSPEPFEPNCLDNVAVPEHYAVFLPLRQLTKGIVEHFLQFATTATEKFGSEFGAADRGTSFSLMVRLSLNLFEHCGYTVNNGVLIYMTDMETPHAPNSHEYQMALQKAKDLEGKTIEFHVIPMIDKFDYNLFYKEFITLVRDVELDSFRAPDAQQLREILADRKLKQDFLRRTLGHFRFTLGAGLELSVQYYNYFRHRIYPRKVKLLAKDNSVVQQRRVIMVRKQDEESQEFVEERQVKTSGGWYEINLGQTAIRITPEQMNRVRNLHQPGMLLLGFKPLHALPKDLYYKPCNFMYPDERTILGSKQLFRALWERCLAREKIAVCLFMRKRKSIPRYVALVPVRAEDVECKNLRSLLSGDGFRIVYLPMAKHIRNIDFGDWNMIENVAPDAGIEVNQQIIKKLRIRYQPNAINDPHLEMLQANLLALGLNIKSETGGRVNMPDESLQDTRIAELLPKYEELFALDEEKAAAEKRKATKDAGAGPSAKMVKMTEEQLQNYEFVAQLIDNKTLVNCTVAQLRSIMDMHFNAKLPKTATKLTIIERINELANAEPMHIL